VVSFLRALAASPGVVSTNAHASISSSDNQDLYVAISRSLPDVNPSIRPKWNTNSDEERGKKDGKEEVHRGADPKRGEATGSRPDGSRDGP